MEIYFKYNFEDDFIKVYGLFDEIENYDKIVYINCYYNKLTLLPELPNSLHTFLRGYNQFIQKQKCKQKYKYLSTIL